MIICALWCDSCCLICIGPDAHMGGTDVSKYTGAAAVMAREASRRNAPKKAPTPMKIGDNGTSEQEGIFKKLTDAAQYTGAHKHRFDRQTGQGLGIDGRTDAGPQPLRGDGLGARIAFPDSPKPVGRARRSDADSPIFRKLTGKYSNLLCQRDCAHVCLDLLCCFHIADPNQFTGSYRGRREDREDDGAHSGWQNHAQLSPGGLQTAIIERSRGPNHPLFSTPAHATARSRSVLVTAEMTPEQVQAARRRAAEVTARLSSPQNFTGASKKRHKVDKVKKKPRKVRAVKKHQGGDGVGDENQMDEKSVFNRLHVHAMDLAQRKQEASLREAEAAAERARIFEQRALDGGDGE